MRPIKGYRLYVNLGASQVRRRLKGHGFGVRKVESAGRRQAVIIHTATGQHQRELEALFQDVLAKPVNESSDILDSSTKADRAAPEEISGDSTL